MVTIPKRGQDPRLVAIAAWRNEATKEQLDWIDFAWEWFDYNIRQEQVLAANMTDYFRSELKSGGIFSTRAWVILDTEYRKELRKRVGHTRREGEDNIFLDWDPPVLSEKSRRQFGHIVRAISDLWEEGTLIHLEHPRLRQCEERTHCGKWFAATRDGQRYCPTTNDRPYSCIEVALRGMPGEISERRTRYLSDQQKKMKRIRTPGKGR